MFESSMLMHFVNIEYIRDRVYLILLLIFPKTMLIAMWRDIAKPPKLGLGTWNQVRWFAMLGFAVHLDEPFEQVLEEMS